MPAGSKRKAPPLGDAHTASPRPPRDPADDCETPTVAYAHLAPLLTKLAQRLKKPVADLRVWDPYHCAGGVKSRLGALGFTHVVNDPELDFYDVVDGAAPPRTGIAKLSFAALYAVRLALLGPWGDSVGDVIHDAPVSTPRDYGNEAFFI